MLTRSYFVKREFITKCLDEAINLSEGTPIIAGTFEETTSAWTGTFTSDDGQVYEIIDGYTAKGVKAS